MNHATVFLAPADSQIAFYREDPMAVTEWLIRGDQYRKIGVIATDKSGEAAAEDLFDLSNNPSRQEERDTVWGANRSLSVGDVVHVENESWLCLPTGWQKL